MRPGECNVVFRPNRGPGGNRSLAKALERDYFGGMRGVGVAATAHPQLWSRDAEAASVATGPTTRAERPHS